MTRDRPTTGGNDSSGADGFDEAIGEGPRKNPLLVKNNTQFDMIINGSVIGDTQWQGRYAVTNEKMFPGDISSTVTDTNATASVSTTLSPGLVGFRSAFYGNPYSISANSPTTTTSFSLVVSATNYGSWPQNNYKKPISRYYLATETDVVSNSTFRQTVEFSLTTNESISQRAYGLDLAPLPFAEAKYGYIVSLLPTLSPTNLQMKAYLTNINASFASFSLSNGLGALSLSTLGVIDT